MPALVILAICVIIAMLITPLLLTYFYALHHV